MTNKKQTQILESAKELFFRYGIKKVTIEEICKDANVSKMTFYKYFPNKTELAKTILTNIFDESEKRFLSLAHNEELSFVEKMNIQVQWKIDNTQNATMLFIKDLYASDDTEIGIFLKKTVKERMQKVVNEFTTAQEKGLIRKDIKPALFLAIFDKLMELAGDERMLQAYESVEEMTREISNFFIYGISNKRE